MKKIYITVILFCLFLSPVIADAQSIEQIRQSLLNIRAQLNQLETSTSGSVNYSTNVNIATPTIVSPYCFNPSRNLSVGSTDAASENMVSSLQGYMRGAGYFSGSTTGVYDNATVEAVKKFQAAYGIVNSGDPSTTGYGSFGPKTRSVLSILCGYSSAPTVTNNTSSTPLTGKVKVDLATDKSSYKDNETILVKLDINNQTNKDFTVPISNCVPAKVDINKPINATLEGPSPCFEFSKTVTIKSGQKKNYDLKIIPTKSLMKEGSYKLTAVFNNTYSDELTFKVTDSGEESGANVQTEVSLNKEVFKSGEMITVTGVIKNNTSNSIVDNLTSCESIKIQVSGLTDARTNCDNFFNYLDDTIYANQSKTYKGYFLLGTSVSEGEYDMTVTFPGGFKEELEFEVDN